MAAARGRRRRAGRAVAARRWPRICDGRTARAAFGAVRHLADLFDRYALHRPEMVRGWAAGRRTRHWQAELWRRLNARILRARSRRTRSRRACARLRAEPDARRPPGAALAVRAHAAARPASCRCCARSPTHRDVHLFLLHPSPALWDRIAAARAAGRRAAREDATARLPREPPAGLLGAGRARAAARARAGRRRRTSTRSSTRAGTLLARAPGRRARGPPAAATAARAETDDRSIQVHACHGRARQVEVLRDAILHLLEDDPTLEPRDVIVMCPDIEAFAPLIQATFGAGEARRRRGRRAAEDDRPPDLRVRLADRSLRQTNPVLGVVARLLDLAGQRLTASQVLDLADREPVRRRFRLDDDDLARLEDWVADSGIRWGLDAEHRAPFKLDELPAGTWRRGLDRLLLGVTMTEDEQRLFGGVLPLDDVESGAIDLAGRLRRAGRPAAARGRRAERARSRSRSGRRRSPTPPTRSPPPRRATPGSAPSCSGCSTTSSREAAGHARRGSRWPRSARCSPSACRAARRARTSAPAT